METLVKIDERWHKEKLTLAIPPSEQDVRQAFANLGIYPARDAIRVYSTIGGFAEDDMDSECLTFWTLGRTLRENDFNAEEVYFADFLIDSHHYYFKSEDAETSAIYVSYGETDKFKIADSFDGFFELYLTNIKSLFP